MTQTRLIPVQEVRRFESRWPGAGFPTGAALQYTVDAETGDLIYYSFRKDGVEVQALSADGYAVGALIDDAQDGDYETLTP